jgi:spermidine synthase
VAAVHIGGGGFSVASWLTATRPGSNNVVLELDGALVEFVEDRFDPAPVDRTIIGDARVSLAGAGTGFDVAVGDAFGGLAVPWHLTTAEFFEEIAASLDDQGFYIMNLIDHGTFDFLRAELATAQQVFPHVAVVTLPERFDIGGNFMLVASKRPIPGDRIIAEALELGLDVTSLAGTGLTAFIDGASMLTDDFAPVDQLLTSS